MLSRSSFAVLLLACMVAACGTPRPVGTRVPTFEELSDQPSPFDTSAFNFLVVGDWGRNGFFNQADVAHAMGRVGAQIGSRFTISTGDNFYTQGVTSTDDVKWFRSFEDIYRAPVLQSRWYTVLGNHDWLGNVQAQIDYTTQSGRWYMPAQYYAETLTFGDTLAAGPTEVLLVFLDTSPMAYSPSDRGKYDPDATWNADLQLAWLDETLRQSDATWKIVIGHHPIYVGSTSYSDNPRLVEALAPMLERHGVQAYFAGHDHNLQHHRPPGSTVDYFVSGAGSLLREVVQTPNTLFALRTSGFMAVSMTATTMSVRAYDENTALVYRTSVPLRRGTRLPLPFGL